MSCLLCKRSLTKDDKDGYCWRCRILNSTFEMLIDANKEAAYNWALSKALDLAGDITGVEPGSAMLEIEDGELGLRTVKKVHTQVARSIPLELQSDDRQNKEE